MNKVEGKVSDWCLKCKNCKGTTNEYDGNDFVVITGVKCEDPYDGMTKTLTADSDVCCSMFEPKPDHGRYPWGKDKNENESMYSELIKASKRKDELIQDYREKLKKANELAESWKRDYEFIRDKLVHPIYDILYPGNPNLDINVTDVINDVKDLKVYGDENGRMYKEIQEWREKCISRGDEISKLQNIVTEKHAEIKGLKRDIIVLHQNKFLADTAMKKNNKLKQTISDQEITIKALLITIKEMCKEDETNE